MGTRVGFGYDVHKLDPGRKLVLCGIEIPYEKGLLGWSDADVATHAIIDALLGAAALGDIGSHFPSGDPRYRNAASLSLLEQTGDLLRHHGWQIGNIDVTIVAQEPMLKPYINEMRNKVAQALSLTSKDIGIKAKTNNQLGFEGEGQGIVAYAVALVRKSDEDI